MSFKSLNSFKSKVGNSRSFADAIINEASVILRRPQDSDMKFGQSGIDYKQSLLNMVDYCENVAIKNSPKNKRTDGKGYLLSLTEAARVRKYINEFRP